MLFNEEGVIADEETLVCEEKIYKLLKKLMTSYKKRKVPLVEVRAITQCLMGSVNEAVLIFLKDTNEAS